MHNTSMDLSGSSRTATMINNKDIPNSAFLLILPLLLPEILRLKAQDEWNILLKNPESSNEYLVFPPYLYQITKLACPDSRVVVNFHVYLIHFRFFFFFAQGV